MGHLAGLERSHVQIDMAPRVREPVQHLPRLVVVFGIGLDRKGSKGIEPGRQYRIPRIRLSCYK